MQKAFSAAVTRSDEIENMIHHAVNVCCDVIIVTQDGKDFRGEVALDSEGFGDIRLFSDEYSPDGSVVFSFKDIVSAKIEARYTP